MTPLKMFKIYPVKNILNPRKSLGFNSDFLEWINENPIKVINTGAAGGPPRNSMICPNIEFFTSGFGKTSSVCTAIKKIRPCLWQGQ